MQRAIFLHPPSLALAVVLILSSSFGVLLYGQADQTATIEGEVLFRTRGGAGQVAEWSKPSKPYVVFFTRRGCKCSDCKPKEKCQCCPPQFTVKTDSNGEFKTSLPPGKYAMQVQIDDDSWKVVDVELKKVGEKKEVSIRIEH
jgi:hypothetical protein